MQCALCFAVIIVHTHAHCMVTFQSIYSGTSIIWHPLGKESSAGLAGCWIVEVGLYGKLMVSARESWPV